jgi:hypothetical protein
MRSHITFDTLEYMDELKNAGMEQGLAEAITKANAKAFNQMIDLKELATKQDLFKLEQDLKSFIIKSLGIGLGILGGLQALFHFLPGGN